MADINLRSVRVGVLMGGVSPERDISFLSGRAAASALTRSGISVTEIDIATSKEKEIKKLLSRENFDIAFIALHGAFGEDGTLQNILETMRIPYTGSGPRASKCAMDKVLSKLMFARSRIPTPRFFVLERAFGIGDVGLPKVIKPHYSGSSLGVSIVRTPEEFTQGLRRALGISSKAVVEEYIDGTEVSVGILGDAALSAVKIVPKQGYYDFRAKYSDGLVDFQVPATLDKSVYNAVMDVALGAHRCLGCRHFSRVDIRLSNNNIPYVLEVNSIPGLTSHSLLPLSAKACGIEFDVLMRQILTLAVEESGLLLEKNNKD